MLNMPMLLCMLDVLTCFIRSFINQDHTILRPNFWTLFLPCLSSFILISNLLCVKPIPLLNTHLNHYPSSWILLSNLSFKKFSFMFIHNFLVLQVHPSFRPFHTHISAITILLEYYHWVKASSNKSFVETAHGLLLFKKHTTASNLYIKSKTVYKQLF